MARERREESQRQLEVRIDVRVSTYYIQSVRWLKAPRLHDRLCLPGLVPPIRIVTISVITHTTMATDAHSPESKVGGRDGWKG